MILDELSRLALLSARLEKPKTERSARADTKKNRHALVSACERRDLDELRRLVDLGAPVNFLRENAYPDNSTLLALCAVANWIPGLQILLDAGANEALIEGYFANEPGAKPSASAIKNSISCLELAARGKHPLAFSMLFPSHSAERQNKALDAARSPELYLACEALGRADYFSKQRLFEFITPFIKDLDAAKSEDPQSSARAAAFDSLARRLGLRSDPAACRQIWLAALRTQQPGALQGLAARGVSPGRDGQLSIAPSESIPLDKALSSWTLERPSPTPWDKNRKTREYSPLGSKPIQAGLATMALALCSDREPSNAYALVAIEPLRAELLCSVFGRHLLSRCFDAKLHKRLDSLGADMASILGEDGSNPLHQAVRSKESKTKIEALARVCASWIDQRDDKGLQPIDYAVLDSKVSLSLLFDQIGLREGLSGRRGARHVAAKTRRL